MLLVGYCWLEMLLVGWILLVGYVVGRIWRPELRLRCGAGSADMSRRDRLLQDLVVMKKKKTNKQTIKQKNKQTNAYIYQGRQIASEPSPLESMVITSIFFSPRQKNYVLMGV